MQKPYEVTSIKDDKDVSAVNNLFTILFKGVQGKEIRTMEFSDTGVWPTPGAIAEKELVFASNAVDGVRLYTKIGGALKYLSFT